MSFIHDIENWKDVLELIPKLQNAVFKNLQKHLNKQFDTAEISRSELLERHKEKDPEKNPVKEEMKVFSSTAKIFQGKYTMEIIFVLSGFKFAFFNELKQALGNITSSSLSNRLHLLENSGIVKRTVHEGTPIRVSYHLTKTGWGVYGLLLPLLIYTATIIETDNKMKK
ncbi:winged helix-turn-helix transcriptional regulator [Promethearchaeum syntrophicum]|uniref:Winged helix-turn-helix transcriptional regulator n=1 Tax=Promethearchaeum syntrophicum TaxID=2594042 RepID=A0A5B9DCR9_9ARCH|nr:helix-turn-helix domain-containing protein [Candidatus Prometheoarchaeum syntrophicum]QEE16912.1 HxlR-like helix-turn-helix [Candidatus Prometheoarchaeum syntrophicum]